MVSSFILLSSLCSICLCHHIRFRCSSQFHEASLQNAVPEGVKGPAALLHSVWTVKWPTDAIQNPWRNKLWLSWIGSFPWVFQALFFSFNGAWCVSTFNFTKCPVHAVTGDSVFGSCGAVLKIVNVDTEPAWREWNLGSYTVRSRNQKSSLSAEASYHPKKP